MSRQRERARNMLLWAMLAYSSDPVMSWRFLLEWARLGGRLKESKT